MSIWETNDIQGGGGSVRHQRFAQVVGELEPALLGAEKS